MLNVIKNAQAVSKPTVSLPFSEFKYQIAKILEKEGFVAGVEKKGKKIKKTLEIVLKYSQGSPAISGVKMVSRPGQRVYGNVKEIKPVKGGYGIAIISTSKGLITNKEVRKQNVGGEIICQVW